MPPFTALAALMVLVSCSHLPRIRPLEMSPSRPVRDHCLGMYVRGRWQLVHAIRAVLPNGSRYTLMGVSQIDSDARTVHCILMTLEGTVMFDARFDGHIEVLRALPPFDATGFAQGILDDIILVLLAPADKMESAGYISDRHTAEAPTPYLVCRWRRPDGTTQDNMSADNVSSENVSPDTMSLPNQDWEIRCYDADGRLTRRVRPTAGYQGPVADPPISPFIELKAFGLLGYELTLTLVDAQPLTIETTQKKGMS